MSSGQLGRSRGGPLTGASTAAADASARDRVRRLQRAYGVSSTSFQVLEPGFQYFFHGDDAVVAYVETRRAWVAAGAPLCPEARLAEVTAAFIAAARAAGRQVCFFGTEEHFTTRVPLASLLIGEEALWDPAAWPTAVRASRSLREQLRRARAKGVRVRAVPAAETMAPGAPLGDEARALVARWLKSRELSPMGFLVQIDPFTPLSDDRLFLAERDGKLVALLSGAPMGGGEGWLLRDMVRSAEAPNGTMELLIDLAMRTAIRDAPRVVTLGLAPLAGAVPPALRFARAAAGVLYDFEGLRAFKAKLRPQRWNRVYLSYPKSTGAVRAIVHVLAAFARGGLLRFGLRTLRRGPAIVVRLLALLLLPWTALLAASNARRWFPNDGGKWGWVAFDVALAGALFALDRRWNERLARALVAAVGADAAVTVVEAVSWNAPRAHGWAWLALAASVAGPTAAFLTLRQALDRRSAFSDRVAPSAPV